MFPPINRTMRSMTGYGRAHVARQGNKLVVEIHSVNKRQVEVVLNLPARLAELETEMRELIDQKVHRGRIMVNVLAEVVGTNVQPSLNRDLARTYLHEFQELQKELGATGDVTINTVLNSPGVIAAPREKALPPQVRELALHALESALTKLVAMRKREGSNLRKDLQDRIRMIKANLEKIRALQPRVGPRFRAQLHERIRKLGLDLAIDEERLSREIVFFAERSDFSEEITRLESHLTQFRETCAQPEAIGRTLEFLSQEIGRELNTLSAKANDAEISQLVVRAKGEMEKIREQIQNIE